MDSKFVRAALTGGLIAAVFDITTAFLFMASRGTYPVKVLQLIASGFLGMNSYSGGFISAALGLVSHFFIAITAAFVYCFAKVKFPLPKSHFLNGLLYGIVVYAVMNFVVLPLSAYPHKIQYTLRGVLVIMLCVGLPISFAARNLMTEKKESLMNTICSLIFILFSLFISVPAGAATSTATLAGGCYWCMEEAMEHVPGVVSVTSGFSGGVEAVEVHFDTAQITYDELLNAFWRNIDPTDAEGQFCDRGDRYRSAIFYHDQQQKLAAERSKEELATKWNKSIATTILPAAQFHPAPDQDYYKKQPYDYKQYKIRCGRERRLRSIWKETKGNQ